MERGLFERVAAELGTVRRTWPKGATAGLLMVAGVCVTTSSLLYHLAAPANVFAA